MRNVSEPKVREEAKQAFLKHEIKIIENTKNVQMFLCANPESWLYKFQLVCADNMICMTGDVYSMLVEPGYGRSGLAWMRGSINSEDYFLEKIRITKDYTEYCPQLARDAVDHLIREAGDDEDQTEAFGEISSDEGEAKFHESWYEYSDQDEAPNVRRLTTTTIYQLEGLRWFCKKLDEMNFLIGETK